MFGERKKKHDDKMESNIKYNQWIVEKTDFTIGIFANFIRSRELLILNSSITGRHLFSSLFPILMHTKRRFSAMSAYSHFRTTQRE